MTKCKKIKFTVNFCLLILGAGAPSIAKANGNYPCKTSFLLEDDIQGKEGCTEKITHSVPVNIVSPC